MNLKKYFNLFIIAVRGSEKEFTTGNINRAIVMLAIPMILEMVMESIFAVVDLYFVSKVSVNAVATVALTESIIMIVYAIAIGVSMSATAMVARRIGEKKPEQAAEAGMQAIFLIVFLSIFFSAAGIFFSKEILGLMGGEEDLISEGYRYTQIMLGGNLTVMLIFLINAIFRGAGDASIAMRVLIIANGLNIILDPIFIFGLGPIPALGVEGAAIATNTGRGIGVLIQIFALTKGSGMIRVAWKHVKIKWDIIVRLMKVSLGGIGQFMIGTVSWIFLLRLSATFGTAVLAGYGTALRIIMFTILPSWGFSNAAATLVGQNLGAGRADRAEKSVWRSAFYNMVFLAIVSVVFGVWAEEFVRIFSDESEVVKYGAMALRIICMGYVCFAYGMVIGQSFNGAGDTRTPTIINFIAFWIFEMPLAWLLSKTFDVGPSGIFIAIAIASTFFAGVSIFIFRQGKWKTTQI